MPEISRRQFAVYLVAVVLVVLLGGRALRAAPESAPAAGADGGFSATGEPGTSGGASAASGASGASGSGPGGLELSTTQEKVLVHVAGRVRRPGVYTLASGARVTDAIDQAGGERAGADLDALNLAAKLTDGEQVVVARRGRPVAAAASPASSTTGANPSGGAATGAGGAPATVNVNTADATALEALTGVGPAIAAKIVEYRTQNGPFKSVDDLAQVSGIGPKTIEGMRAQVVV